MHRSYDLIPNRPRHRADVRRVLALAALLITFSAVLVASALPAAAAGSTIAGRVFEDRDRDGSFDEGEPPSSGQILELYDASGSYVAGTGTNPDGLYSFTGLADGTYRVQFRMTDWWAIRSEWVPTTTGSLRFAQSVSLVGSARADFGRRRIVRSTDIDAPISSFTGPQGLRVKSYDDVVSAREIYDALMSGSLVGPEAQTTTIYFDFGSQTSAVTSVGGTQGSWSGWSADVWIAYVPWVDSGDTVLFHEYGHDWSLYNAYIVQQDPTLSAYLQARGLAGDPRLNSNKNWDPNEMIAEDYRQLFGSPNARSHAVANTDIPQAYEVPGLEAFLRDVFTTPPAGSGGGSTGGDTGGSTGGSTGGDTGGSTGGSTGDTTTSTGKGKGGGKPRPRR